jgi:hypothetical protein
MTWQGKLEVYRLAVKALQDANARCKVLYTSTALPYDLNERIEDLNKPAKLTDSPEFLQLLISENIPVDAIGLEFYYAGSVMGNIPCLGLDMVSISTLLDQYATFGKPVFVTEFSAPSTMQVGSGWWHSPWNEQIQAEYLKDFYTIAFSKFSVKSIMWSYGLADNDSYVISGGLLDSNLNPKPSYYALKNLVDSWTTRGTGETDESGTFEFRGFAGDYNVTIENTDGQIYKTQLHIDEQKTTEISVALPSPTPIKIWAIIGPIIGGLIIVGIGYYIYRRLVHHH